MRRIAVVGTTGAGKTTMARMIAERLNLPHVELDALHWDPGWTAVSPEVFLQRTREALQGDAWVVDGNYRKVRDYIWGRADTLVWLDYAFPRVFSRLTVRTFRRIARDEALWNGNKESLRRAFLSRDSIFVWQLRTHWRRRRDFTDLIGQPEWAHLALVHLRSPAKARAWLDSLRHEQLALR